MLLSAGPAERVEAVAWALLPSGGPEGKVWGWRRREGRRPGKEFTVPPGTPVRPASATALQNRPRTGQSEPQRCQVESPPCLSPFQQPPAGNI